MNYPIKFAYKTAADWLFSNYEIPNRVKQFLSQPDVVSGLFDFFNSEMIASGYYMPICPMSSPTHLVAMAWDNDKGLFICPVCRDQYKYTAPGFLERVESLWV